jgi:hypothetical protein
MDTFIKYCPYIEKWIHDTNTNTTTEQSICIKKTITPEYRTNVSGLIVENIEKYSCDWKQVFINALESFSDKCIITYEISSLFTITDIHDILKSYDDIDYFIHETTINNCENITNILYTIYLNKKYLVYYTCYYGISTNISFKIPPLPSNKYKCYYYTNNNTMLDMIKGTQWIGVFDDKPVSDDQIESCMQGKYVKILPHLQNEINKYKYACFLDSKLDKLSEDFIERYIRDFFINQNYALLLRQHPFIYHHVWNEFHESMKQDRYVLQREQYCNYINKQVTNGLHPSTMIHCACGLLIRNMRHSYINNINTTWYDHLLECGIQDQISFFFIKQHYMDYIHAFREYPFE